MAVTSYIKLIKHIEDFATQHYQIQGFRAEMTDQMPVDSSIADNYPFLFMSLESSIYGEFADSMTVNFFCYSPITKDRTNINYIISDTSLVLNDLKKYLFEGDDTSFDVEEGDGFSIPIDEITMDYVAGHQMTLTIVTDTYCVDDIPLSGSTLPPEADCPVGTLTVNSDAFTTIPSGGIFDLPVVNISGTTIGSKISSDWVIGNSALSVNSTSFTGITAEDPYNLIVKDSDGATVGSKIGDEWIVPAVTPSNKNTFPYKTGQVTSYGTDTDGDLQFGRGVNWTTLDSNNPYGNTTRFLDLSGTTTFADGILIDWGHVDEVNELVLGWSTAHNGVNIDWANALAGAAASTLGGYTDWRLPNIQTMHTLANFNTARLLNYAPFNEAIQHMFWSSTTDENVNTYALCLANRQFDGATRTKVTSAPMKYYTVRTFTYAELGL